MDAWPGNPGNGVPVVNRTFLWDVILSQDSAWELILAPRGTACLGAGVSQQMVSCVSTGLREEGDVVGQLTNQHLTCSLLPKAWPALRSPRMTSRRARLPPHQRASTLQGRPGWPSRDPGRRPWKARSSLWTRKSKDRLRVRTCSGPQLNHTPRRLPRGARTGLSARRVLRPSRPHCWPRSHLPGVSTLAGSQGLPGRSLRHCSASSLACLSRQHAWFCAVSVRRYQ